MHDTFKATLPIKELLTERKKKKKQFGYGVKSLTPASRQEELGTGVLGDQNGAISFLRAKTKIAAHSEVGRNTRQSGLMSEVTAELGKWRGPPAQLTGTGRALPAREVNGGWFWGGGDYMV